MNMYIKDVSKTQLDYALEQVNEAFDDNVEYAVCEPLNKKQRRWRVRLIVKDSYKRGAKRKAYNGYHMKFACWHVCGHFLNALPYGTLARSTLGKHYCGCTSWKDDNVGSAYYPVYLSKCCVCAGESFVSIKVQMERQVEMQKRIDAKRLQVETEKKEHEEFKQALDDSVTNRFTHKYRNCSD